MRIGLPTRYLGLLAASVTASAVISSGLGATDQNSDQATRSNAGFTTKRLCTWETCLEDNREFIAFVEENLGQTVEVDFEIDIPFGAGEFQSQCYGKLVLSHPHDGADEMIIAVLPGFDHCFPPGAIFLRVSADDIQHVTAVTGSYTDRIAGAYTVNLGSLDGSPVYTLKRNPK